MHLQSKARVLLCLVLLATSALPQSQQANPLLLTDCRDYFAGVRHDGASLWNSSRQLKVKNLAWLVPLGAAAGVLIGTDRHTIGLIHGNAATQSRSANISNAGLAALGGAAAVSYGIGAFTHNDHARETGILTAEALTDTFFVSEAMKLVAQRDRPEVNGARGLFWQHTSLNSSLPSEHSALAWSAATVFAHEYPGPLTQVAAYGLASLVSVSRVTADKHFPSDVLIGAATGYLIGRYVYSAHHRETQALRSRSKQEKSERASVYVPLDSWIYPALRRLADWGYIPDQTSNIAPWTRAECLHQVDQASARASREGSRNNDALRLIAGLRAQLQPESDTDNIIRLESVYTRFSEIAGKPLRDSYHFGQTLYNDFGRPYDQGFNNVTGFSSYAVSGVLSAYVRGEYQSAPGRAPASQSVQNFTSAIDGVPSHGNLATPSSNRFEPLEMYIGAQLGFENITFGKQSLWWGPGTESAFSFSNNAAPLYMLRFAQVRPLVLPGVLQHLGKIRTEILFGKLSGHQFPARPYMNAQKISLALTDDLELGFTRSAFFGGVGHPLTLGSLKASLFSTNSIDTGPYGLRSDLPGDRHSGFDFRWRLPGLRHYVTVYSDSYADDDPSPIDNPRRSAWSPGLYLTHLPHLSKLDLRFETYSTRLYANDFGGNFLYWNNQYRDSYTNNGYLLGSWIGRNSRAYLAESTFWSSAQTKLTGKYRQIKAGPNFLPGGGTQTDISLTGNWSRNSEWMLTAQVQGERYDIPLLGTDRTNILTSIGFTYTPANWSRRR